MMYANVLLGSTISGEDVNFRGSGADFKSVVSNFIQNITGDNENARAALISTEGLERIQGRRRTQLGSTVVVVVTNTRLIFIAPDAEMELEEWSLAYGDIASVTITQEDPTSLEVETLDEERWQCRLPNANPEVLDALTRHLRWIGSIRGRIRASEESIDAVATEIREQARAMNWDAARDQYRTARQELDALIVDVYLTTPTPNEVLAPELTALERTLEEANVRFYIERARSQLELGRYLVEHENYDRAAEVLDRATQLHQQAEGQSDAVKRADAFQFGRQRELSDEVERFGWELETIAAEPVRQAQEAGIRASETDDATTAVEYWETAFRRYSQILELDWQEKIEGGSEELPNIEAERETTAEHLATMHGDIGHERRNQAISEQNDGNESAALERCRSALTHLRRAHELAVEFGHDDAERLASHLAEVEQLSDNIREHRSPLHRDRDTSRVKDGCSSAVDEGTGENSEAQRAPPEPGTADPGADDESSDNGKQPIPVEGITRIRLAGERFIEESPESDEWIPPSKSDIAEIETHHELTFDLAEIGLPSDVCRDDEGDNSDSN